MRPLLFLDVEATGTEKEDRLLQVAYRYHPMNQGASEDCNEMFTPPVPIKIPAMAIHHITPKMLEGRPSFEESHVRNRLRQLSAEGAVFIAHNAKYDLGMLEKEEVRFPVFIDTLKIARHIDTDGRFENHQLQYLRYFYGIEIEAVAHDAFGDILVLERVFEKLMDELADMENPLRTTPFAQSDLIDRMIEITRLPSLVRVFTFGKYGANRELVADVAKNDPGYLQWLLEQKSQKPEGEEDWIYTLKHYLQ
jgi:DNA polymerase III epsilon subunit-like protein